MNGSVRWEWREADPPLAPAAMIARGPVATRLLERLVRAPSPGCSGVVGADGAVVLLGRAESLPWLDGVVYLGRHPEAPGVLFPTTTVPGAPLDLVARALRRMVPDPGLPVAVVPTEGRLCLYPLGGARPLGAAELRAALDRRRRPA